MKMTTNMLLMGLMTVFCCSITNAQVIYSYDFTSGGSGSLDGTAPTVANSFAGGNSSATWNVLSNSATAYLNQNGTMGANQNTALLPFTPVSGYNYSLSATVTFTGNAGSWIALGFAGHDPAQNAGSSKMTDTSASGPDGIDWMIAQWSSGNNEQIFAGSGTANNYANGNTVNGNGTYTLQVDLDTAGSSWVASAFINGVQIGTDHTYGSNPTIAGVGLGQNSLSASANVQWDNWQLSAVTVPEPSAMALTSFGLAGACMLLRRKK